MLTWLRIKIAMIVSYAELMLDRTAYYMVRRGQATIANYQQFNKGNLSKYMERDAFLVVAERLAHKYFHKSVGLALHDNVVELYQALLVLAPILQRLPLSYKIDWHRGHLLGFVRTSTCTRKGRFHAASREVERQHQPDKLAASLEALGIHDADFVAVLQDLYRRHCGGTTLQHHLAHQLFDPVLMHSDKQGFELRYGNKFLRFEKEPFEGSVDLRHQPLDVLDFSIKSEQHHGGRHLEIHISESCLSAFRLSVKRILESKAPPEYKLAAIETKVHDFVERTKSARSALQQVKELKIWLANKLRGLSGTAPKTGLLPHRLLILWSQRVDGDLYLKRPNFFLDPKDTDENTYLKFFSPYREV